jgi:hypothetical protein
VIRKVNGVKMIGFEAVRKKGESLMGLNSK